MRQFVTTVVVSMSLNLFVSGVAVAAKAPKHEAKATSHAALQIFSNVPSVVSVPAGCSAQVDSWVNACVASCDDNGCVDACRGSFKKHLAQTCSSRR